MGSRCSGTRPRRAAGLNPSPLQRFTVAYQKPLVEKFGSFRELTRFGLASATDGASIWGISSPGCSTTIGRRTWEIGCPDDGPSTS